MDSNVMFERKASFKLEEGKTLETKIDTELQKEIEFWLSLIHTTNHKPNIKEARRSKSYLSLN